MKKRLTKRQTSDDARRTPGHRYFIGRIFFLHRPIIGHVKRKSAFEQAQYARFLHHPTRAKSHPGFSCPYMSEDKFSQGTAQMIMKTNYFISDPHIFKSSWNEFNVNGFTGLFFRHF